MNLGELTHAEIALHAVWIGVQSNKGHWGCVEQQSHLAEPLTSGSSYRGERSSPQALAWVIKSDFQPFHHQYSVATAPIYFILFEYIPSQTEPFTNVSLVTT